MTISVLSFSPGTTIKSADVNSNFSALTNVLNGSAAANVVFLSTSNSSVAVTAELPSSPAADQIVLQSMLSGDVAARIGQYVRSSDGYGGIAGGAGGSITSHLYATATGWNTPETLAVNVLQFGHGLIRQIGVFSGTGAGTFNHNCGTTPDWVGITENVASATMTVGVDSIGSTTVHVNTGTASAWIGVAIVAH